MTSVVSTITSVAPENTVPLTTTVLPPAIGPALGATPVTVGGAKYVYWSAPEIVLVPPGVVTLMSTVPADPAGTSTVMLVALLTEKHGAVPHVAVTD